MSVLLNVALVVADKNRGEAVFRRALLVKPVPNRARLSLVLLARGDAAFHLLHATNHARDAAALAPAPHEIRLGAALRPVPVIDVHGHHGETAVLVRQTTQHGGEHHRIHAAAQGYAHGGERKRTRDGLFRIRVGGVGFGARPGVAAPRRSPGASSSSRVSALSLPRASHTLPRVIHRLAEKLRAEESLHRDVHGMVEHRRRHFRVRVELVPLEYLVSLDVLLPLQVLQASQGGAPELRDEVRALGVRVHAFV